LTLDIRLKSFLVYDLTKLMHLTSGILFIMVRSELISLMSHVARGSKFSENLSKSTKLGSIQNPQLLGEAGGLVAQPNKPTRVTIQIPR
jgi:hypothetical protein